jgi:hypothetical protein
MSDVETAYRTGRPCWYLLNATDTGTAREFYGTVLGWTFDSAEPNVHLALVRGRVVAAIGAAGPDEKPAWTIHLATGDAAETCRRITNEGGTVIAEPRDTPAGVAAIAADPTGAVFGLWQGRSLAGSQVVDEPGAPCWAEASSTDTKAAAAFYGTVFGLETARPFRGYSYTQLRIEGTEVAGILGYTHERRPKRGRAAWLVYYQVADVDAAVRAAVENGGTLVEKAEDTPFGRFAIVGDPTDARVALITRPAR